jgi:hypothetical protein
MESKEETNKQTIYPSSKEYLNTEDKEQYVK